MGVSGNFSYLIKTTDWSGSEEDYSEERPGRGIMGDYPIGSRIGIVNKDGTRGTGTVVGEENKAPPSIEWGDTTETLMLNFSIEGSGDTITIDKINISHGGDGEFGDCRVFIYNETDTIPGTLDGGETPLNPGGTDLSGSSTPIDIINMNIGAGIKTYMLITVVFTTDLADVGDFHYINITAEKDFQLNSTLDDIQGNSFPLSGGPIQIIFEFPQIFIPVASIVVFFFIRHNLPCSNDLIGKRKQKPEKPLNQ
jgi:hypothetical protein